MFSTLRATSRVYAPGVPLQRWEMAVWMVRILDRKSPAHRPATTFEDVTDDEWWAVYTYRLAKLGVTQGCATQPDTSSAI